MKKKIFAICVAVLALGLVCGLAFAEGEVEPHEHVWVETARQEPTCINDGWIEETCSICEQIKQPRTVLPATGKHTWQETARQEPTCTEEGWIERTCSVCETIEQPRIRLPKKAHSYEVTASQPATCVAEGWVERTCTVCEQIEQPRVTTKINPDNHAGPLVDVAAKEATCTEPGTTAGKKCSACGAIAEGATEVAAKGHTWQRNGFDINNKTNRTEANGWKVDKQPAAGVAGSGHYECGDCGAPSTSVSIDALPSPSKPSTDSGNSDAAPAATEAPALPYGSIVSDIERADEPYVPETVADETGANTILVITADPDEDGTYTLRNLHITDELLAQLNTEGILTVRFVVGDATVEFPVASFTGDAVTTIKGDLDADVTAFLVTIDPNATTADGQPGVSVGSSVVTTDAAEYDVTPLIPDLSLTIGDTPAQPVTTASVYTAQPAAEAAPAEPAIEEAPAEEAPAEPAVEEPAAEEPAAEEPAADEAVAA